MTTNEFKQSYKHFLINVTKHSKHSANKYISYINKVCKLPGMQDLWDRLAYCDDAAKKTQYAEELCDAIIAAFDDPHCILTEKELRDGQSSAHVLLAFVSGQTWTKHKGIQITFVQVFSNKALTARFKGRLRTQDRIYSFGAFPIDLICKIATKHKVRTLWDDLIAQTKFVFDAHGNTVSFADISRVMLGSDHRAYFEKNGQIYTTFTKIVQQGTYNEIITNDIGSLSLDHDIPVERALRACLVANQMPEFKKLSDDIVYRFMPLYKGSHPKAKNQEIVGEYAKNEYDPVRLKIDEKVLLAEVQRFINALSLTIMDKGQNSAKSNRTLTRSSTMVNISSMDIAATISNALKNKKKNILFISRTLEYEAVLDWFARHSDYYACRTSPTALYEEKNGILTKNENCLVIDSGSLEKANNEECIWFHNAFSEKSVLNFAGFVDILKNRFYINHFPDGSQRKHSLERMAMFIAFTTPHNENDWAALDEKYYDLFDEVYLVE